MGSDGLGAKDNVIRLQSEKAICLPFHKSMVP